jgi:chemotaxis-related protein WspD
MLEEYDNSGNESIINTIDLDPAIQSESFNDCWNKIGVMGDRTCSELAAVIHCYECPVYAAVGDSLLERRPPANYLEGWSKILEETASSSEIIDSNEAIIRTEAAISIIVFRLGSEKLALPVRMLQEVTHPCAIQPLPHRSNELFLGLVNIRGSILLCASMSTLLNIHPIKEENVAHAMNLQRMIVAGQGEDNWVFPVDEVHGIFRFHLSELQDAPVVITKSEEAYTKGIVFWEGQKVNYLDSDLLFYTLNQKIL